MRFKRFFMESKKIEDIRQHLIDRGMDPDRLGVVYDEKTSIATFFIYNLNGQIVGYQQYNPNAPKTVHQRGDKIDKMAMKYYTYLSGHKKTKDKVIGVWGLDTYLWEYPLLFVTEGIFDAVKLQNAGVPAIAVLTNDIDKQMTGWIRTLPQKIVVIYDNDEAEMKDKKNSSGMKLIKTGDYAFTVPEPYKDVGDMPQKEVNAFVDNLLKRIGVDRP